MEISFKWVTFGILALHIPLVCCFYPEYVLEDHCQEGNEKIIYNATSLGSVGKLVATSRPPYQPNKNCTIVIQPPAGQGVVISIRKIDFRQTSFFCMDYLKVYHSDIFFPTTTLCNFKFDLKEKLSYYSKGRMELLYHVESKLSDGLGIEEGFMLTFTVVSEDLQTCLKDDMYMCDNGRCLPKSLTCDMKNNCGDNSDESLLLCDTQEYPSLRLTDVMYGIVLCVLIFILVSSCAIIISRRRRRNHDTDSDSDEPTTRLAPYQTAHPSGFFICQNPAGPATPYFQHSKIEGGFSNPCYTSGMPQAPPPYSQ